MTSSAGTPEGQVKFLATDDDRRIARAVLKPLNDRERRAVCAVLLELAEEEGDDAEHA